MLNFLGTTFRSEESLCRTVSGSQYIGSFSMLVGLLVLVDTTRCSIYLLGEEASPSIGNTLWRVSTMFTRLAITPDLDENFGTPSILFGAGRGRSWARSAQKRERETLRKFCFFLSGKQRTTLPIFGQPNFTKFAHKTWFCAMVNPFGIIFLPLRSLFFQNNRDHRQRFPTSSRDFSEMITNLGKS